MLYIVQAAHERGTVDIVDEAGWILYAVQCRLCVHAQGSRGMVDFAICTMCICVHAHCASHRDHEAWWMATGVSAECTPPTPLFPSQCRIAATWSTSLIS